MSGPLKERLSGWEPMSARASHENTLNTKLSQILRHLGLQGARAEYIQLGSAKQIDVDVQMGASRVAMEAEIGSRTGAFKDALARRGHARDGLVIADNVIAVNYPAGLRERDFSAGTMLEWSVLPPTKTDEMPAERWTEGTVWHLAGVVRRCRPSGQKTPNEIASELDSDLDLAIVRLSERQRRDLAAMLGVAANANRGIVRAAAKRALLIVAAAGMFHCRLDDHLPSAAPIIDAYTGHTYTGPWPPAKLQRCLKETDTDLVAALNSAWRTILAVDYRPIFETARRVLSLPAHDPAWPIAVRKVTSRALHVSQSAASSRHDLMGNIFHKLVDTARHDGSYYTRTSAAVLLAGLAIRPDDLPETLSEYSLIDPACGTGTLLMSAAERIRDLRPPNAAYSDASVLIEEVMTGMDVNLTACHMAATALGLLSPSTTFSRMNIRLMHLGIKRGVVRLGSLDLLTHATGQSRFALDNDWASGEHIDTGGMKEIGANSQQLVIMNPPYTRDSLRYDQFPPAIEQRLKEAEQELMKGRAGHGSSSGTMFMDLGEHLTSLEDGATIAFVYPAAGAAAPSNLAARKLLAEWFWIEWIVASHDHSCLYFSESTKISEILVIARRHSSNRAIPPTKFLILRDNPNEPTDAASLVAALENGTLPSAVGTVEEWPTELMQEGTWRPLGLTSAHLADLFRRIEGQTLFASKSLSKQAVVGPAGQRIREAYSKEQYADRHGRRGLWHNKTAVTRSMATTTDTYIHPIPKYAKRADNYWQQRSRLLLVVSPRLNTAHVNAVHLERPALGSAWVPARFTGQDTSLTNEMERAMCAYLNSTLGWISMVGVASPKVLSRPALSLNALRQMPVPDFERIRPAQLAAAFDQYAQEPFLPLREAANDKRRARFDTAVAKALGIDTETMTTARNEIAREPSVKARPHRVLPGDRSTDPGSG